ncbi:hypothetical protein [Bifidobacterium adolescentis]|uniref:hypothetical protein n=1 Tax=Bifidobacterium adolescentis TaxID=1680 RepID=UPI0040630E23
MTVGTKPFVAPTGTTSAPSTGFFVLGMAIAAAVALIAGVTILLKKKRDNDRWSDCSLSLNAERLHTHLSLRKLT